MSWLTLHDGQDGSPIRLRTESIESYRQRQEGLGAAIWTGTRDLYVTETADELDRLLGQERVTKTLDSAARAFQ